MMSPLTWKTQQLNKEKRTDGNHWLWLKKVDRASVVVVGRCFAILATSQPKNIVDSQQSVIISQQNKKTTHFNFYMIRTVCRHL